MKKGTIVLNRPLRFLVGGVQFGNHNVGDEAILEGIVAVLRKVRPNCEITVLSNQPYLTKRRLGIKSYKYQFVDPGLGKISKIFRAMSRVFENLLHVYLALQADVVVCAGGTILSDSPSLVLRFALLAVFANKRLVHFPGGMNPGNYPETLNKLLVISEEFDLFLVRDVDTKKRLVNAGFNSDFIKVTIDPAFNIELGNDVDNNILSVLEINNEMNLVGVGISNEPDCSKYNLPLEWAKIADFIVAKYAANIVFLPSNTQEGKDLMIMKATKKAMKYTDKAYIIDVELSPKDMISCISKFEMMISSRMHQLIFSCLAESPFVSVSRCAKIDSFLALFDMLPASTVRDLTLEKVRPVIESIWQRRKEVKEMIKIKKESLLRKSLETERLVGEYLNSLHLATKPSRSLTKRGRSLFNAFFMRL